MNDDNVLSQTVKKFEDFQAQKTKDEENFNKKIKDLNDAKNNSDRQFQNEINKIREENKKELKKLTDPEKMKELKESQLKNYLKHLSTKKWSESLENTLGVKHNVVVGNISVGKSSLLNYMFNLKLKVGFDETTMKA